MMDVREKMIEILRKPIFPHELVDPIDAVVDYLLDSGVTVQEDCKDCAEATQNCIVKLQEQISELRSAHEWISVDDRMPTQEDAPTEYVFTAYKNQNCYDVEIALWDTVIAYPDMYDYWMALPLPQPPKGE